MRHQLLSLLLKSGDHARLKENLEGEKAAGDFSSNEPDCLNWELVATQTPVHLEYLYQLPLTENLNIKVSCLLMALLSLCSPLDTQSVVHAPAALWALPRPAG